MIWVTWRQHRTLLVASGGLLALMLAVLFVTGLGISHTFHATGLAAGWPIRPHGPSIY